MIRAALLLALLGGCENILGLQQLHGDAGPGSTSCDPQGHDDDGDGVADCRDVCPGISDDQTDTDHDGVGDACDPQPGKQDHLVKFYAFDADRDVDQFTMQGGHWFVQGDAMANDAGSGDQEDHLLEGAMRAAPIAIEANVTVDKIDYTPPAGVEFEIAVEYRTSNADEYSCEIRRTLDNNDNVIDQVQAWTLTSSAEQPLASSKLGSGAEYQIREVLTAGMLRCEVTGAAGDGGSISETVPPATLPESVGLLTEDTVVHYHNLAIYALGN